MRPLCTMLVEGAARYFPSPHFFRVVVQEGEMHKGEKRGGGHDTPRCEPLPFSLLFVATSHMDQANPDNRRADTFQTLPTTTTTPAHFLYFDILSFVAAISADATLG